jgi:hypothetical protein
MKTYTKEDFHNPEQLTRQQVGDEYRLLLLEEADGRFRYGMGIEAQCVGTPINSELNWIRAEFASCSPTTYRVPLATPLPDGTVLGSNECCWSDAKPNDPRKVVYCCGPMSNMIDYNFPAFFKAAKELEKQGYKVFNPAQMDLDSGWTLEEIKDLDVAQFQEFLKGAAKRDLDALQQCDAIALLPGWENSKGARAEKAVAEWLGLETIYLKGEALTEESCEYCQGSFQGSTASGCVGPNGDDGELGSVDTGYSDHIKQPDADGWIPHTPGDPMPCNPDERVEVKLGNGLCSDSSGRGSSLWYWGDSCMKGGVIVAWRPAQSKQPYNSDERAEWGVDAPTATSTPQYAPDDPKGAAGAKKPPMHLLPPNALIETAKAMGHGAAKYGAWNFIETTVCASTYVGALGRHWAAYARSEDIDPDSGLPHLALIAANCFVLLTAQQQGTLRDDRPKLK